MKAVLISIRPKWCELIASGKKTVEVRKSKPKLETPFKVYIYCTNGDSAFDAGDRLYVYDMTHPDNPINANKMIIGEFVCDKIFDICIEMSNPDALPGCPFPATGLTDKEILQYLGNGKTGYGWHISQLKLYDHPKELGAYGAKHKCNLSKKCTDQGFLCAGYCKLTRPPQSWCYVEELT